VTEGMFLVGKPKGKRPLGRCRWRWKDNMKMDLTYDVLWTGLIWLRIGIGEGLLWTRQWTCRFHKMLGNCWVAGQLVASQEGLSSL
jgi:hypothetical protein